MSVLNTPPPSGCSWTKCGKIFDAGGTTSYVLKSGVTEPNITKILHDIVALVALLIHAYKGVSAFCLKKNRSSGSWDNFSPFKKEEEISASKIYGPVGKFAEQAKTISVLYC